MGPNPHSCKPKKNRPNSECCRQTLQVARNVTNAEEGFLRGKKYLLTDRDTKFSKAFRMAPGKEGVWAVRLPSQSPNSAALSDLLNRLMPELSSDDWTVYLGDYIDRGPDPKGCIDQILGLHDTARGSAVALMGNHEDWLLKTCRNHTRHSWILGMEAFETIRRYSREAEHLLR